MRCDDDEFLTLAEDISQYSTCKYQLGAIITNGRRFVCSGINKYLNLDPTFTRFGLLYSIHSELSAIGKIPDSLDNKRLTLYVARRKFRLAKPCEICMRAIVNYSPITRIVYSHETGIKEIKL